MSTHCGLCQVEIDDWEEHVKSEQHQRNLGDPSKILESIGDSQGRVIAAVNELQKEEGLGTTKCPYKRQAGSYYSPLPWSTCSKLPNPTFKDYEMCDIDAGRDCRFTKKEDKKDER